jgi:glycosyltransferase involved in cell wall biosynthesis
MTTSLPEVHVVLPEGVDDPERPSGGNVYDRRVCRGLAELGWGVREHLAPGRWPVPGAVARGLLRRQLQGIPAGSVVLVDGLVGSAVPDVLAAHADRLRLVALVHLPLGHLPPPRQPACRVRDREAAALRSTRAVIATSHWTRRWLLDRYGLSPDRVGVAAPGVDPAPPAPGSADGDALICVGAVSHTKGQDVLVAALSTLGDLPWSCVVAGSCAVEPAFSRQVVEQARRAGIGGRVRFAGALGPDDLADAYARADALVLASRAETYAMVASEALARGLPVIGSAVGGVPEAVGQVAGIGTPGVLVRHDAPDELAGALRRWLLDPALRARLRQASRSRRETLRGWPETTAAVSDVLTGAGR